MNIREETGSLSKMLFSSFVVVYKRIKSSSLMCEGEGKRNLSVYLFKHREMKAYGGGVEQKNFTHF